MKRGLLRGKSAAKLLFIFLFFLFVSEISAAPRPPELGGAPGPVEPAVHSRTASMKAPGLRGTPQIGNPETIRKSGTLRLLAIMVQFTNETFDQGKNQAFYQSLLTDLSTYYNTVSLNALSIVPTVVGPYNLPHTEGYYGAGWGDQLDPNLLYLMRDAINAADAGGANFANYDAIMVIHAGVGEEVTTQSGDNPHIWSIFIEGLGDPSNSYQPVVKDGVQIYAGCLLPETTDYNGTERSMLGVYAHEFGHQLGLPDLYNTLGTTNGVGDWCLMSYGSYNSSPSYAGGKSGGCPAPPSAPLKKRLGWSNPVNVAVNTAGQVIQPGTYFRLWTNGSVGQEYFLLENKRRTGYDSGLPAEGLLIWHVDESKAGNASSPPYVKLIQADGRSDLENKNNYGDSGDPYPGSSNNTNFTPESTPPSNDNSGLPTKVRIKSVTLNAPNIIAHLNVSDAAANQITGPADNSNINQARISYSLGQAASSATVTFTRTGGNADSRSPHVAELTGDALSAGPHENVILSFQYPLVSGSVYQIKLESITESGLVAAPVTRSSITFDNTGPVITNVTASNITTNSVRITWNTGEAANSRVDYGPTTSYGSSASDSLFVVNHVINISGLTPGTLYNYRVTSADVAGNSTSSANYTFTTLQESASPNSIISPSSNAFVPNASVSYTLGDNSQSGSITWQWASGVVDSSGSHVYNLTGEELTQGSHTVNTALPLVSGARYNITLRSKNSQGRDAPDVSVTNITFDVTPPVISNLQVFPGKTSATITWTTDDLSDSTVKYSVRNSGNWIEVNDSTFTQAHSVTLTGLTAGTTYTYQVRSTNRTNFSSSYTSPAEFTTTVSVALPNQINRIGGKIARNGMLVNNVQIEYSLGENSASATIIFAEVDSNLDPGSPHSFALSGNQLLAGTRTVTPAFSSPLVAGATYNVHLDSVASDGDIAARVTVQNVRYDSVPPSFSNVVVSNITTAGAKIEWKSSEPSSTGLLIGTTTAYGTIAVDDPTLKLEHAVTLSSRMPNTLYHFKIYGSDEAMNTGESQDFTFTTAAVLANRINFPIGGMGHYFNSYGIDYTIGERSSWGRVVYRRVGGVQDSASPHTALLQPSDLIEGNHVIVLTPDKPLVSGTIYDIELETKNMLGSPADIARQQYITFDNVKPVLLGSPVISNLTRSTATIAFNLSEPAVATLEYGLTASYGNFSPPGNEYLISYTINLTGLTGGKDYHYRISAVDKAGNQYVSPDYVFTTSSINTNALLYPPPGSSIRKPEIIYFLGEDATTATVTFEAVTGFSDPNSPHTATLSGSDLKAGEHHILQLILSSPLVNGVRYNISLDSINLEGRAVPRVSSGNVLFDSSPPVISNISAEGISSTSAVITWVTDEPATSRVLYGRTRELGSSTMVDSTLLLEHSVVIGNLEPLTRYCYRVVSADSAGNSTISEIKEFTTLSATNSFNIATFLLPGTPSVMVVLMKPKVSLQANDFVAKVVQTGAGAEQLNMTVFRNDIYVAVYKFKSGYEKSGTVMLTGYEASGAVVTGSLTFAY